MSPEDMIRYLRSRGGIEAEIPQPEFRAAPEQGPYGFEDGRDQDAYEAARAARKEEAEKRKQRMQRAAASRAVHGMSPYGRR